MELVIDATALFSVLIARGSTPNILFASGIEWLAPDKLKEEFEKHIKEIVPKSSLTEVEVRMLIELAFGVIRIVPRESFQPWLAEAKILIRDINDAPYIALSLSKNKIPIWSNDPHFKGQTAIRVFTTGELVNFLSYNS